MSLIHTKYIQEDKMNIKDVTRKERKEVKNVRINLKITKSISEWMKEKNISPQMIFDKSIVELSKT